MPTGKTIEQIGYRESPALDLVGAVSERDLLLDPEVVVAQHARRVPCRRDDDRAR